MYRFQIIEMSLPLLNGHDPVSYGILAEQEISNGWIPVTVAANVSRNQEFVLKLAQKCTYLQLDPMHLADVVEDALQNENSIF